MKIAAVCCTYNRPRLLRQALWMFQQQTHLDKELVILDDAGQYDDQKGENWKLVSVPLRFRSFGEKRNFCTSLVSSDVDAIAIWDDDDLYYPWALEAHAAALENSVWSRPSLTWDRSLEWTVPMILAETFSQTQPNAVSYHGAWAFLLDAIEKIGGYPSDKVGDQDTKMGAKILNRYGPSADPLQFIADPYYVYCYEHPTARFSDFQHWNSSQRARPADLRQWGTPEWIGKLTPKWVTGHIKSRNAPRVPWAERQRWQWKNQ